MKRYKEIDILKGLAVILMIIYHLFYFPNMYGFKEIEYNTIPLKCIARIAQVIFITCVGINLVFSFYNSKEKNESKKKYYQKNIYRVIKLCFYALFMTFFTFFVFGDSFVRFGILHLIALSSLLLFPFIDNLNIIRMILSLIIILYILIKSNPKLFTTLIPSNIAPIFGFYFTYPSIDHFPLIPWLSLICFGILIGHKIYKNRITISDDLKKTKTSKFLQKTGEYSLEIYMIHWLVIYLIFCHIYPKYFRVVPNLEYLSSNININQTTNINKII